MEACTQVFLEGSMEVLMDVGEVLNELPLEMLMAVCLAGFMDDFNEVMEVAGVLMSRLWGCWWQQGALELLEVLQSLKVLYLVCEST